MAGRVRPKTSTGTIEHGAESNLRVNTFSLILSNALTCVLGLVFWGAAAKAFPADDVGVAAALINSALMLATLSILSIDRFYERFLPVAGDRAGALVWRGCLTAAGVAMLGGMCVIVLGPRDALFTSDAVIILYPLFVIVVAVFILQDKLLAGLGVARWAAAKNAALAVVKLVALLVVASAAGAGMLVDKAAASTAIVVAWGVTAALIAVVVFVAIGRRCRSHPRFKVTPTLPPWKEVRSYFGSSFGISALLCTGALLVPLIVVAEVGAASNAYFQITWQFVGALYLTIQLVVSPFVAEAAAHPDKVPQLSWRMVRMLIAVALAGSIGLVLVGPAMLSVLGAEYRTGGQELLYLAAMFIPLSVVGAAHEAFARVQRRLRLQLAMTLSWMLLVVGGSLLATPHLGVSGVGWAYLAAELVSATVLIGPVVLWLTRGMKHVQDGGPGGTDG
ncbi:AMP-dependent synthetase [Mycolicibacterium iranicum]|uniref:AMP-dependent synthetase n=1 Tax=Mycolicibacterium iranicum TaxID=912594 RepID=A0A178LSF8_MYCIR|nr:AMP-dependent synthetase [Mycolicibacterium iranicum]